jgi:hypothetical protein
MRHTLDGFDVPSFSLRAQHQARAYQPVVEDDAAGAAVAGATAFLGSRQPEPITQDIEQRLVGLAKILDIIAIDCG